MRYQPGRLAQRRWILAVAGCAAVCLIMVCSFVAITQRNGNFHIVEPGQFYRVSRVPASRLAELVKQYDIQSVLNLEGARPDKPWYQAEAQVLDRLNVKRYDYGISATHILAPDHVAQLLEIVRDAPKPILVHCHGGADRSGLVAALYLAKILDRDEDKAYEQLSMSYGHFQYLWSSTEEMDDTYWAAVDPARDPD